MNKNFKRLGLGLGILAPLALPFLAGAQTFDVATGTATQLTANVTDQLAVPGVTNLVILAIGIPLFFYVVHKIMGLLPGSKSKTPR